jgi:hypothetical protein
MKKDNNNNDDEEDEDVGIDIPKVPITPIRVINPNFSDNPMYPITVYEVSSVIISIYQADKRFFIKHTNTNTK